MSAKTIYPIQYQSMADRGFKWRSLRDAWAQEIILWQHVDTQEYHVTIRFNGGRVEEFQPTGNGTLTIVKPEPRSATADPEFAIEHGVTLIEEKTA